MKTTWVWSPESEANRLIQTLHNVGNGFYTSHRFDILPISSPYKENSVHLPDINYRQIKDLWERLRDVDIKTLPAKDPHNLTADLIPLFTNLTPPDIKNLKTLWDQNQTILIKAIYSELPWAKSIQSLTIYSTYFGTQVSFGNRVTNDQDIIIYARKDATIHSLVEAIISSILRPIHNKQGLNWNESEAIIDHLTTNSRLGYLLNKIDPNSHQGTIISLINNSPHTSSFLTKIGAPSQTHSFAIINNLPAVNGQPLHHLTTREIKILSLLITKSTQTTTYDEIADLIFETEDDYSLAVIGKAIERLRSKLESNGISGSVIGTERGLGYYLKV